MKAGRRWPGCGQKIEAVNRFVVEKDLAQIPRHAFVDHPLAAAEPVEDFQRALGEANGARPRREPIIIIEQQDTYALLRQIDSSRKPYRPRADHYYPMPRWYPCVLIRRSGISEDEALIVDVLGRAAHDVLSPEQALF